MVFKKARKFEDEITLVIKFKDKEEEGDLLDKIKLYDCNRVGIDPIKYFGSKEKAEIYLKRYYDLI